MVPSDSPPGLAGGCRTVNSKCPGPSVIAANRLSAEDTSARATGSCVTLFTTIPRIVFFCWFSDAPSWAEVCVPPSMIKSSMEPPRTRRVACETHARLRVQILLSPRQYTKWREPVFTDTAPLLAHAGYVEDNSL